MQWAYVTVVVWSGRTAVKAVVERLGQNAFYSTARALFERDRQLFALLSALEVSSVPFCVLLACVVPRELQLNVYKRTDRDSSPSVQLSQSFAS